MEDEINIDLLESSLLLGLYFLSFCHANVLIKVSIVRDFLDYKKPGYDDEILTALRTLNTKGSIIATVRKSREGVEDIMSVALTNPGMKIIEEALQNFTTTASSDLSKLEIFLEQYYRRLVNLKVDEMEGRGHLYMGRRIDVGFILLLGSVHVPGLFTLEGEEKNMFSSSRLVDILLEYLKRYLNPELGRNIDEEWYPSKIIDLGISRLFLLERYYKDVLRKYLKLSLGSVKRTPVERRREIIDQFHKERYLHRIFFKGKLDKRLLIIRVLHLDAIIPAISWCNSGESVQKTIKRFLAKIGGMTKLFKWAALMTLFIGLILLILRVYFKIIIMGQTLFLLTILIPFGGLVVTSVLSFVSYTIRYYWLLWEERFCKEAMDKTKVY